MRTLLGVTASLVGIVSLWLVTVVVVLSGRDPESVPIWAAVSLAGIAVAAVAWQALLRRSGDPIRVRGRVALAASGLVAIGIGAVVLAAFAGDPHSEDALVPIGLVFAAHGLVSTLAAVSSGRVTAA